MFENTENKKRQMIEEEKEKTIIKKSEDSGLESTLLDPLKSFYTYLVETFSSVTDDTSLDTIQKLGGEIKSYQMISKTDLMLAEYKEAIEISVFKDHLQGYSAGAYYVSQKRITSNHFKKL